MKKIHYGWVICLNCTVVLICTMGMGINVFPLYLPYLEVELCPTGDDTRLITLTPVGGFRTLDEEALRSAIDERN